MRGYTWSSGLQRGLGWGASQAGAFSDPQGPQSLLPTKGTTRPEWPKGPVGSQQARPFPGPEHSQFWGGGGVDARRGPRLAGLFCRLPARPDSAFSRLVAPPSLPPGQVSRPQLSSGWAGVCLQASSG